MVYRIGIVGLAIFASGCAALPTPQTSRGVNVDEIVDRTKCELASIMRTDYGWSLRDWSAKVTLDLKVLYDNSGGPSAEMIVPYHAGTVELTGGFGGAAQSNRVGHLSYNIAKLQDIANLQCDRPSGLPYTPNKLGLEDWLVVAVRSVSRSERDFVDLNELSYTLEFVVEQNAAGEVRFRSVGHPTTGTGALGGKVSAKDSNTLLVSLVPPAPGPSESRIRIVNWPRSLRQAPPAVEGAPPPVVQTPTVGSRIQVLDGGPPRSPPRKLDPNTQQRLDDLQVKQRLFNSITVPRSTLNAF